MTISAILFDFGGVLCEPLDVQAVMAQRNQLAASLGFADGQTMWNHFYVGDVWQDTKTGKITETEMWARLLSPFGLATVAQQEAFTRRLFAGEGVHPGMRRLLDDIFGRYPLSILSNASDRLEGVLDTLDLSRYFDLVVNSHRIGVAKPDEAAYQIALQQMNFPAEEVLFIDNQERNTLVAQSLGIQSVVYTNIFSLLDELAREEII